MKLNDSCEVNWFELRFRYVREDKYKIEIGIVPLREEKLKLIEIIEEFKHFIPERKHFWLWKVEEFKEFEVEFEVFEVEVEVIKEREKEVQSLYFEEDWRLVEERSEFIKRISLFSFEKREEKNKKKNQKNNFIFFCVCWWNKRCVRNQRK